MKKGTQPKVPENFWTTLEGAPLYDTLHRDGWEAIAMLNSVKEAFDKAIDETQDAEIKAELEKSRSLVIQSTPAYQKAPTRLPHINKNPNTRSKHPPQPTERKNENLRNLQINNSRR